MSSNEQIMVITEHNNSTQSRNGGRNRDKEILLLFVIQDDINLSLWIVINQYMCTLSPITVLHKFRNLINKCNNNTNFNN